MNKNDKYRYLIFFLLCGLLLLSTEVFAADKVLDVNQLIHSPLSLTEYFDVLEDPGQTLTLADVQKPDIASHFKSEQASAMALNYGLTRSAYWLRLSLRNASDHPVERMLEITYPLLSSVQLHQSRTDGTYRSLATGSVMPFAMRPYPNRAFIFPLTLPAHSSQVVYLRIQSATTVIIPARLWEPLAFHVYERNDYIVQGWYFGMAAAMILFNFLLFIALRDGVYFLYVSFATCMALGVAIQKGLAKEFLWPDAAIWADLSNSFGYLPALAAMLFFMRGMLDTAKNFPKLDRLLKALVGGCILIPIGLAVSVQTFTMPAIVFIIAGLILTFGSAVFCALKRQRSAYFFVASYIVLFLAAMMSSLLYFGLVPANMLMTFGMQFGSAVEMLLLAFALADRFIIIRHKAINDVKQVNASLEQRLQEREAELTEAHHRLRRIEQRQLLSQERQRMMQDMHDGLGSSLVSALRVVEHGRMSEAEVAQVLRGCIDDLKLAIDSMEPVEADLLLLLATLRFRLGPRLESTGIALRWEVNNVPPLDWLDPKNALHILRILQEAFTNIIKHTRATEIRVATGVQNDQVAVTITDNGQGFPVASTLRGDGVSGKGLSNQIRRAEAVGAEISWESNDVGTCLTLRLPIKRKQV
ncbi:signal transduction histidine kinase [Collimonas sp. PA-H2]|uniref:sensor histidine kinase n=1 Tax=Collimonas sp. PA-H2 TaxID=1881062 RepID=UPI000BF87C90|nr:7TM diverse intracellular signaling domain-containing protein [Collimonas sp. PA-H2]PFH08024.1 signal transduction histidine kinase [Collimonas sp. PA-H2]